MQHPNLDKALEIHKSLALTNISAVLEQPEVQREVANIVDFENPLRMNLPRRVGRGEAWRLNRRAPSQTFAAFVNDTEDFATPLIESTGTYTRHTFEYKTIASKGKISRFAQRTGSSLLDVMRTELEAKATEYRDFEEWALFKANKATNTKAYDGLDRLLAVSEANSTYVVLMTTAVIGAALTIRKMDELMDAVTEGPIDMLLMSRAARRDVYALLVNNQRFVNMTEVRGGFRVGTYQDVPIFISTRIPNTQVFNGSTVTAETGGTSTSIYAINTREVFVGELTPFRVEPLANVSTQFDDFEAYSDHTLVFRHTNGARVLIGVKIG